MRRIRAFMDRKEASSQSGSSTPPGHYRLHPVDEQGFAVTRLKNQPGSNIAANSATSSSNGRLETWPKTKLTKQRSIKMEMTIYTLLEALWKLASNHNETFVSDAPAELHVEETPEA